MRFTNDVGKVEQWLSENIGACELRLTKKERAQIDRIAAVCMSAYDQQPGDKTLIGFFPFSDLQGGNDMNRNADGICCVSNDGKSAAIGISLDILRSRHPGYIVACLGLHEVAHLRYDSHDDNFTSYVLELQYTFFGAYDNGNAVW